MSTFHPVSGRIHSLKNEIYSFVVYLDRLFTRTNYEKVGSRTTRFSTLSKQQQYRDLKSSTLLKLPRYGKFSVQAAKLFHYSEQSFQRFSQAFSLSGMIKNKAKQYKNSHEMPLLQRSVRILRLTLRRQLVTSLRVDIKIILRRFKRQDFPGPKIH